MSYREKEICAYRGWKIKEINNGKQNWYCGTYNYQDIDADTIEKLIDTINIIQNKCEEKIKKEQEKRRELEEKRAKGIIPVEDFEKAAEIFGIESPVITAIWNTMMENPENQNEFETIFSKYMTGKYDEYDY
jgi:hypothetical protein